MILSIGGWVKFGINGSQQIKALPIATNKPTQPK